MFLNFNLNVYNWKMKSMKKKKVHKKVFKSLAYSIFNGRKYTTWQLVQIKRVIDLLLEVCTSIILLLTNLYMFHDANIYFFYHFIYNTKYFFMNGVCCWPDLEENHIIICHILCCCQVLIYLENNMIICTIWRRTICAIEEDGLCALSFHCL